MVKLKPEVFKVAKDLCDFLKTIPIVKKVEIEEVNDKEIFGRFTYVRAETNIIGIPKQLDDEWLDGPINLEYKIYGAPKTSCEIINSNYAGLDLMVRTGKSYSPIPLSQLKLSAQETSTILDADKKVTDYLSKKYITDSELLKDGIFKVPAET